MLTCFRACPTFSMRFSDNAVLLLLSNMINVPYRVNCALSPKTSNGRPSVEAKLFYSERNQ